MFLEPNLKNSNVHLYHANVTITQFMLTFYPQILPDNQGIYSFFMILFIIHWRNKRKFSSHLHFTIICLVTMTRKFQNEKLIVRAFSVKLLLDFWLFAFCEWYLIVFEGHTYLCGFLKEDDIFVHICQN